MRGHKLNNVRETKQKTNKLEQRTGVHMKLHQSKFMSPVRKTG